MPRDGTRAPRRRRIGAAWTSTVVVITVLAKTRGSDIGEDRRSRNVYDARHADRARRGSLGLRPAAALLRRRRRDAHDRRAPRRRRALAPFACAADAGAARGGRRDR